MPVAGAWLVMTPVPVPAGVTLSVSPEATMNSVVLHVKFRGFLTQTVPVEAPAGTVAVIWASESCTNGATTLLNFTEVTLLKPEPWIVTTVPEGPHQGSKASVPSTWG